MFLCFFQFLFNNFVRLLTLVSSCLQFSFILQLYVFAGFAFVCYTLVRVLLIFFCGELLSCLFVVAFMLSFLAVCVSHLTSHVALFALSAGCLSYMGCTLPLLVLEFYWFQLFFIDCMSVLFWVEWFYLFALVLLFLAALT